MTEDQKKVLNDFAEYRRGAMAAFHLANMINANRQGRTAEETCAYLVRSLAQLANGEANQPEQKLTVWYGSMPESNGKSNWTAILHKGDLAEGHTIDRSEYPDRVRYEADCVRYLIGELDERPLILDYDADKHSGYVDPHR